MWDFLAINTYLLCSTMYLFLPLIPDLAMVRDRTTGWQKIPYRILSLGFRGTEGEWKNLHTAMNIFAFAIIPVMFSVHTIVSWDFAMAMRPGWSSSVFGPYFVIGALHSGMAAVAIVLFLIRSTMKNMKYFIRPEHFNLIGKLMLMVSMAWAYFYFNDYLVPWYGGDKWEKILQEFTEKGPLWWLWYTMLICNIAVPWLILWNKKWRSTPWLLASVGVLINIGMWIERYVIIPDGSHDQPHALHLAHLHSARRDLPDHRHDLALPAAVHAGLAAHPADPGLGSAGGPDGAHAAQESARPQVPTVSEIE